MKKEFLLVPIALLADQLIKLFSVLYATPGGLFVFVKNTGITFGFLPESNGIMIGVSVLAAVALVLAAKKSTGMDRVGILVVLSGVLGNAIDRIFRGYVVDWLAIGRFPVFNLADSMIVCGIIILIAAEIPAIKNAFTT